MSKMDSIDRQIIALLGQNARQSSEEVAKQLNLSSATVRRRIRSLIKRDLLRIIGVGDPGSFGFSLAVCIAFDVEHDKLESTMAALIKKPEIKWAATTTGRFDIIVLANFSSTDYLSEFLKRDLSNIEGVKDYETLVCLEVAKGRYVQFTS